MKKGLTGMENPTEIKRKHFRFPAYDDELGVKLTPENKRVLFQDELVGQVATQTVQTEERNEPSQAKKNAMAMNMKNTSHNKMQREELTKHRLNLPDYQTTNRQKETPKKTNLFGSLHKKARDFGETKSNASILAPKKHTSSNRSYFVPTYTPASVIPEKKQPDFTEADLLSAMKKDKHSYLLFDEEVAAFQVKGNDDPSVKKFNIPSEEPEIPVTRRQYQQIKPDMERFGEEHINHSLPRSRKELKEAKVNAKNQTAYGRKIAEQDNKKGILDKSLSGIIQDSSEEMQNSKYFT